MLEKLLAFITSIRWQDFIDIAFNSYILFRLHALFRGTDAFRVLVGIAFLWILQRLAVSLGLILTSWMMEGIIAVAALIVIVVFRNEIRSVFRARNIWAILWGLPRKPAKTPLEIITESVFALAKKRIGLLIVLPGKEDLEEFVQQGVSWDGRVSREMIESVFWPKNPVHDGAAIITEDRVVEVGAILPLSKRKDFPSFYGTRHRAAAGLAEVSDAVVICVSEERGSITVTKGFDLFDIKEKEQLLSLLKTHLGIREDRGQFLRKRKIELRIAALVSFLIVTAVWFSISRGLDAIKTFDIPVEYANQKPNMEMINTSATSVQLSLRGSRALLKSIRPEQIRVKMDLGKAVEGTNTFPITDDDISIPPGVALKEVSPMMVDVSLDTRTKKILPIQVDWVGKLPSDLILVGVNTNPSTVEVSGPKTILENMKTIYTAALPLNDMNASGKADLKLVIPSPFLKLGGGADSKVEVAYKVNKRE